VGVLTGSWLILIRRSAVSAAVVGVVLNLAVCFALHTVFETVREEHAGMVRLLIPESGSASLPTPVIGAGAFIAMLRFKLGMLPVLGAAALAGAVLHLVVHGGRESAPSATSPSA
jgi:chromate transporter